jgi:NADH-quinone oxidoreductase subunit C
MPFLDEVIEALREEFGSAIKEVDTFRDQRALEIDRDALIPLCQRLRDHEAWSFNFLAALTAVDYWPQEPRFAVVYQLLSIPNKVFLGLRVLLAGDDAHLPTLEGIYPNANWHEREVYDMFGITFDGHSDMRRILMPHDWEGHPLRKDYPLGYEEVQFSFNYDEVNKRKKYARE